MSRFVLEDDAPSGRFVLEEGPAAPKKKDFDLRNDAARRIENYSGRDAFGGMIRGAGSFGATIARPFESADENQARRDRVDENMVKLVGANPESQDYKASKLATEVAGTWGMGGLLGKAIRMIPGASSALPTLIPAIESGGMVVNGAKGAYGLANRVAGGTVLGGASAGAVDPKDTGGGVMAGGALPVVAAGAGAGMTKLGEAFSAPPISPVMRDTARESIEAGYVIPPNMVNPSFKNQVVESIAGKQATQQIASTRNTQNTERLVREALSIPADMPMNKATLESLRKTAGKTYAEVSALSPQAAADLEALKVARNEAQAQFNFYNRSADPKALAQAKELRAEADNLENLLEFHAAQAGKDSLIDGLRKARKEIAKTYTVERALNDASGTVDARILGRMYEKGSPLSDGLDKAGRFASAFPTVAKSPQQVGSPAAHNLKSIASMAMAGGGYAGMGPAGLLAAAVPFVAPPLARARMFSRGAQRGLLSEGGGVYRGLLGEPEALGLLTQGAYRAGPLLSVQ